MITSSNELKNHSSEPNITVEMRRRETERELFRAAALIKLTPKDEERENDQLGNDGSTNPSQAYWAHSRPRKRIPVHAGTAWRRLVRKRVG